MICPGFCHGFSEYLDNYFHTMLFDSSFQIGLCVHFFSYFKVILFISHDLISFTLHLDFSKNNHFLNDQRRIYQPPDAQMHKMDFYSLSSVISQIRDQPVVGQLIPDCYVELERIILSERKNVPIEFPVIDRKRLLQLVREHQLQLDENELPHAVHFLNESGLFITYFFKVLQQSW